MPGMSVSTQKPTKFAGRKRKLTDDAPVADGAAEVAQSVQKKQKTKAVGKKQKLPAADGDAASENLAQLRAKIKAKVEAKPADKAKAKDAKVALANSKQKPTRPKQTTAKEPPTKKERRALKKQQKPLADLVSQLLRIWEELRIDATPPQRVAALCDEALTSSKGKLAELAHSHDTARVIEAVLKRGSDMQRWQVFNELKENLISLSKSKFGKHVAMKLLKYGGKQQRAQLMRSIEGKAPELLQHKQASDIVEYAWNEFATASQRSSLLQEFFGPQQAVFKSDKVHRLADALANAGDTGRRSAIVDSLRGHLLALARKGLVRHSLVHHLLLQFLAEAPEDEQVLDAVREQIVPMLHTREGVKAGIAVLRRTTGAKLKLALKSMKTFLCTAAVNEHGYLFILALIEQLHSPDLLHKFVLRELFDSLAELTDSQFGRKVLLYLLKPRDPLYFSPQLLLLLPTETELEELKTRLQSALQLCGSRLLQHLANNMQKLCNCNQSVLLVAEAVLHCPGDKSACCKAIAELIAEPFAPNDRANSKKGQADDEQQLHIIERPATHMMLKRLLVGCPDLVQVIGDRLSDQQLAACLACNRGCFFLLQLYENCPSDCNLGKRIGSLASQLLSVEFKGAQLLAEKIKN